MRGLLIEGYVEVGREARETAYLGHLETTIGFVLRHIVARVEGRSIHVVLRQGILQLIIAFLALNWHETPVLGKFRCIIRGGVTLARSKIFGHHGAIYIAQGHPLVGVGHCCQAVVLRIKVIAHYIVCQVVYLFEQPVAALIVIGIDIPTHHHIVIHLIVQAFV